MKFLYLFLAVLFAVFTGVQWNDPDAFWWMLFYGEISLLFGLAGMGRVVRPLILRIGLLTLVLGLYFLPGAFQFLTNQDGIAFSEGMSNEYSYIEEAREFGGLLIAFLSLLGLWMGTKESNEKTALN